MRRTYTLSFIFVLLVNILIAQSMPPVQFSVERGFYDTSFTLKLSSDSTSATIRYTLDGTAPTPQSGTIYTNPIAINSSSIVRAIAYNEFPVISLVTDKDFLFNDSIGIYTNSQGTGSEWERPVSIEMIHPDGTEGFQENAGLRIMGGITRKAEHYKKHSFRLLFKSEYGAKKFPQCADALYMWF